MSYDEGDEFANEDEFSDDLDEDLGVDENFQFGEEEEEEAL